MDNDKTMLKKLSIISFFAVGILFIIGIIYARERVVFGDAAFCFSKILYEGILSSPNKRYGALFVQFFPYVGQMLHLPLNTCLYLYGASFYFFYLLIISLLVFWLKEYRLAILFGLFNFMFVSQSYIWISDVPQGIAWLLLCFGLTNYLGKKKVNIFIILIPFILLSFLAIFSHLTIIIPAIFLWVYFIIERKNWYFSIRNTIILTIILIVISYLKYADSTVNLGAAIDNEVVKSIKFFNYKQYYYALRTSVINMYLVRLVTLYWFGTLIFIIGIIHLIWKKKFILASLTFVTILFYFIIMGLTYGQIKDDYNLFHIEAEWLSNSIVLMTPFTLSFIPVINNKILPWLFGLIIFIRLIFICMTIPPFTARLYENEKILMQMRKKSINKLVLYNDKTILDNNPLYWALPWESMIMSQLDGDKQQLTFFLVDTGDKVLIKAIENTKTMECGWGGIPELKFKTRYFTFDSLEKYHIMTYEDFMK